MPPRCMKRLSCSTRRILACVSMPMVAISSMNGGTLFMDEIATMGMDTQAKILRVLQDRRFMHLGGIQEIQVDVRIIAATNIDLRQAVREGKFREDLFYRLNVIAIDLPALRSRREDIPLLVNRFLEF